MSHRRVGAAIALLGMSACAVEVAPDEAPRAFSRDGVGFTAEGRSTEIELEVPPGTRSLTLIARGDDEALYALASLRLADGSERIGLPAEIDLPWALEDAYRTTRLGELPGAVTQSPRLGTFTFVYPNRPGDLLPPGPVVLRFATDRPTSRIDVRALMPADDGAETLMVNVFAASERMAYPSDDPDRLPWLDDLAAIFAPAGLRIRVGAVRTLVGAGRLDVVSEPHEGPTSQSAALVALVPPGTPEGLNLFVVDELPPGLGGWSLGTPGPPIGGTYYSGVVVEDGPSETMARHAAHEIAHFLGLNHLVNRDRFGREVLDRLDDTELGEGNLMEDGRSLTGDQSFVLGRSALLVRTGAQP